MEMSTSEPVPDNEEENVEAAMPEKKLTLAEGSDYSKPHQTSFATLTHL